MMIPKQYTQHTIKRIIAIIEEIVSVYERIVACDDIRQEYTAYISIGSCKICEYVGRFKLSCKAICPFCVVYGKTCQQQPSYYKLAQLCDTETSRPVQIRILNDRIEFHKGLLLELNKMLENKESV